MALIKKDKRSCCGIPLALAAMAMCLFILCNSVVHLTEGLQFEPISDGSNVATICIAVFELLFSALGLVGVLTKSPKLCNLGSKAVWPTILAGVIGFIAQWWRWGWALNGKEWAQSEEGDWKWVSQEKWKPTSGEATNMAFWTIMQLIYLFILFRLISVFASLANVFKAGGSGWKWHNAQDYLLEKNLANEQDDNKV